MRVLFNAESAIQPPRTGVGQYAFAMIQHLSKMPDVELTCFSQYHAVPTPTDSAVAEVGPSSQAAPCLKPIKRLASRIPPLVALRNVIRNRQRRRSFEAYRSFLYHEPNHILHPGFQGPTILSIHDLSVVHFPQMHPPDRVRYFNRYLQPSVEQATRIIASSEFTRQDLLRTFNLPPEKISVVLLGMEQEFHPGTPEQIAPVLAKYGLGQGGYILSLGTREPRKNLERLMAAHDALPDALRARYPLVLTGPKGWQDEALEARLQRAEQSGTVRRLGFIPDTDRQAVYAGAALFAYPSLYEGFGLPPLEAAGCGTPVLTSRNSPMEEVLGETALLVDPLDQGQITEGLRSLLEDRAGAAARASAAQARAARFTWASTAAQTAEIYRSVRQGG